MKIFLDTNVLASGLTTRGLCAELIERILSEHTLFICDAVLWELERVLGEKFRLPQSVTSGYLGLLHAQSLVIPATNLPRISLTDPDDVPIVACAIAGKVEIFITGDKALLNLCEVEGLPLLSPRQAWQKLAGLK